MQPTEQSGSSKLQLGSSFFLQNRGAGVKIKDRVNVTYRRGKGGGVFDGLILLRKNLITKVYFSYNPGNDIKLAGFK